MGAAARRARAPPDQSGVTVFACVSPDPLLVPGDAGRILRGIASSLPSTGINVEGEGHMYYWGDEEAVPLARLLDHTLLPLVRGPEMIHAAVIGGDSQWFMGMSAGWGNYGGYAVTKPVHLPR